MAYRTIDLPPMLRRFAKSKNGRINRRGLRCMTNTLIYDEGDYPIMQAHKEDSIVLGTNDYRDLYVSRFKQDRIEQGINTIEQSTQVRATTAQIKAFIRERYAAEKMFSFGQDNYVIVSDDYIIEFDARRATCNVRAHGTWDRTDWALSYVTNKFEPLGNSIRWIYDANMSSIDVPLNTATMPCTEMYPFLGDETLDEYYDRYMDSSASIMILIGPAGMAKTHFIKGFLHRANQSAIVCYDEKVLSSDSLFATFVDDDNGVLVIEDADIFLSSRKDGNDLMHKFLNVGDGLVTVQGKKIIFSTNLPNVKDIDEALLRPGRCHDVLQFNYLSASDAEKLVDKLSIDFKVDPARNDYSIAEIFSGTKTHKNVKNRKTFGFI